LVAPTAAIKIYTERTEVKLKTCFTRPVFSASAYTFIHTKHIDKIEQLEAGLRKAKAMALGQQP
jgi:hypothetical protein